MKKPRAEVLADLRRISKGHAAKDQLSVTWLFEHDMIVLVRCAGRYVQRITKVGRAALKGGAS